MVNLATYVGSSQAGLLGAVIATLAVILPSFIIILIVMVALKTILKNMYVQAILRGLKPCIIGIILATGVYMLINNCIPLERETSVSVQAVMITAILAALIVGVKAAFKKRISPIALIVISACLGIIVYGI